MYQFYYLMNDFYKFCLGLMCYISGVRFSRDARYCVSNNADTHNKSLASLRLCVKQGGGYLQRI